jgi:hypothetical protein
MSWPANIINNNRLLRGLMKITLVFGLITFSGSLTESRAFPAQPFGIELKVANHTAYKSTFKIKETLCVTPSFSGSDKFIFRLLQDERKVIVRFKDSIKDIQTFKDRDRFIRIVYSTNDSEAFSSDFSRA